MNKQKDLPGEFRGNDKKKLNNAGFTFVEVIATVAIIVILLAVSGVAVAQHRSYLQIMELDDAAREIYMAAENRAVLLASAQRLDDLVQRSADYQVDLTYLGESAVGYYVSEADSALLAELLPANSIDQYLRNGCFYIVYEPISGCVTDVFYAQKAFTGNFPASYDTWRNMDARERMQEKPMFGYFGGGMAQGKDSKPIATASVQVIIENAEELTVKVICNLPVGVNLNDAGLKVTLSQDGMAMPIELTTAMLGAVPINGGYMWTLDSLAPYGSDNKLLHFKDLGGASNPLQPGKDFTVKAVVDSGDKKLFLPASAQDSNNSLFAEGSNDNLARIRYLRHLQNLDSDFSGVEDKQQAKLIANIECQDNETYPDYEFIPIKNDDLQSFAGSEQDNAVEDNIFKIYDLRVTAGSAKGKAGAGLFAEAFNTTFRNLRLINAQVQAEEQTVGALVGAAYICTFDGCQIFWQRPQTGETLKELLGSDDGGTAHYKYQIVGKVAGGLAGQMNGGTIRNSLAATLVRGAESAGGLVGGGSFDLENAYADCYLNGSNRVGGLVGNAGSVGIQNCYVAGFIDMDGVQIAAALTTGVDGKIETYNVYSALCRLDTSSVGLGGGTYFELTESQAKLHNDDFVNTFFLGSGEVGMDEGHKGVGIAYMDMIKPAFVGQMGAIFGAKGISESHPYNLREHLDLTLYSFPGLKSLPHYGDWEAKFSEPSLVYYEKYSDGSYGFSGGNARYLLAVNMTDSKTVVEDGYATAFLQDDMTNGQAKLTYSRFVNGGLGDNTLTFQQSELKLVHGQATGENYYLALLPGEVVNAEPAADEEFYSYIKMNLQIGSSPASGEYFYNPRFAETVIPYKAEDETQATDWTAESAKAYAAQLMTDKTADMEYVQIRTPRHLYNLSRFAQYYNQHYTFEQQIDLDYASYTGYGLFNAKTDGYYLQQPIGNRQQSFNGRYLGGRHKIAGVGFKQDNADYLGLFGYSEGVLQDIVYWLNDESKTEKNSGKLGLGAYNGAQTVYAGGLVGLNAGEVQNCAVAGLWLESDAVGGNLYAGGLVGRNDGLVRKSSADVAMLANDGANYAHVWLGGLVGYNASSINSSYAVGRLSATVDKNSAAKVCGFAGYNQGGIKDCYTATDLRSSGLGAETFGFCGQSGLTNCYFLDKGNFTYREVSYIADYVKEGVASIATSVNYADLTTQNWLPVMSLGSDGGYPYPRIVNGGSVHYGAWPTPLDLGEMGVYYWEKLKIDEKENYYISLLAVNPNAKDENGDSVKKITKSSTLSDAYNDGGAVIDYGYGYYNVLGAKVELTTEDIYYTANGAGGTPTKFTTGYASDSAINNALKTLMPGFEFHSWHSFQPDENGAGSGLYPYKYERQNMGSNWRPNWQDVPIVVRNGSFKLEQTSATDAGKNISAEFWLDPHFADALAVKSKPASDWQADAAIMTTPGSEDNHYAVRSVAQLEFINWNIDNRNTRTVLYYNNVGSSTNNGKFPYLSNPQKTEKYYWRQTHDLDGSGNTYTPIAEYYDMSNNGREGYLYGWFGGEYDGKNYVIANMNIKGQVASCAGLFGAVYNGKLKNIILYSADGNGEISGSGQVVDSDNKTLNQSVWYGIGGLAGLAASNTSSAVENCAVAGYTIYADIYNNMDGTWGGSGIGGLIGISNMALSGCSAVADIVVPETTIDKDNMRIGGLVGACQQSISNCYAGGTIQINSKAKPQAIYIGGIVGGSYMKPLQVGDGANKLGVIGFYYDATTADGNGNGMTDNAIYNCYSYVQLPANNAHANIGALYALGGTGEINSKNITNDNNANHGICTIKNSFYLDTIKPTVIATDYIREIIRTYPGKFPDGVQKTDVNGTAGVTAVSYRQLAGWENLSNGGNIYSVDNLNKQIVNNLPNPGTFAPVTSTKDGHSLSGKYSFPPSSRNDLRGRDYPFPTILIRGNADTHVHYGEWPKFGIVREKGGEPINLDVFAERQVEEQLGLSQTDNPPQNGWSVISKDQNVATAEIAGGKLTVRAVNQGSTELEVRCVYNNLTYDLTITVNVTAELHLSPQTFTLFGNDTMTAPLQLLNKKDELVAANDAAGEVFKLTYLDCTSQYLSVQAAAPGSDGTTRSLQISSTPAALAVGEEVNGVVNAGYNYNNGTAYSGSNALTVTWQPAPQLVKHKTDSGVYLLSFDENSTVEAARFANSGDSGKAELTFADNAVTLSGVQEGTVSLPLVVTLKLAGQTHTIRLDGIIPTDAEGRAFALQREVYAVMPDAEDERQAENE